jgi:hypothetical protein
MAAIAACVVSDAKNRNTTICCSRAGNVFVQWTVGAQQVSRTGLNRSTCAPSRPRSYQVRKTANAVPEGSFKRHDQKSTSILVTT